MNVGERLLRRDVRCVYAIADGVVVLWTGQDTCYRPLRDVSHVVSKAAAIGEARRITREQTCLLYTSRCV